MTVAAATTAAGSPLPREAPSGDASLRADDFALFGLPRRYALDLADLDQRRRALQAEAHPDRHAAGGAAAQRRAVQLSARINDAYARLRHPVRRAVVLCELAGVTVDAENNTAMPLDFLEQQMAWREALDDADDAGAIAALQQAVATERAARIERLRAALDDAGDASAAAPEARALMFIDRFASDLDERQASSAPT